MIKVRILSPEWNRSFEADAVFLPGVLGEFEILPGHAPIISVLSSGKVRWRTGGKEECLEVRGGVARLDRGELTVCVESEEENSK